MCNGTSCTLLNGSTYFLLWAQLLKVDVDSCRALLLLNLDNKLLVTMQMLVLHTEGSIAHNFLSSSYRCLCI